MPSTIMGTATDRHGNAYASAAAQSVQLETAGGLALSVGLVADAVGGGAQGADAAQTALDAALGAMRASRETDVPALLRAAFTEANRQVYAFRTALPNADAPDAPKGVSLAVAALLNDRTLYIASLGVCRVYLYRRQPPALSQLTYDHTFLNLMLQQGRMSRQTAQQSQQANQIVKLVGVPVETVADTGVYSGTSDPNTAATAGQQGIALEGGDTVVILSANMVRRRQAVGMLLVPEPEIMATLAAPTPEAAAQALVAKAAAANPQDGVSAVVLQAPAAASARAWWRLWR